MPEKIVLQNCFALIFSPHPDDAEIGIAGTVAKWTKEGKRVIYVICTNGDKGSEDPKMTSDRLVAIRQKEELAAADLLGVNEVVFLGHPDQELEDTPLFRKELVGLIRLFRPDIVATSDISSPRIAHRDHRITGQVVLDAVYPFARNRPAYPDMIKEGLMPHSVKEIWLWGSAQPDHFVDITATYEKKIAAIKCHVSQFGDFNPGPHDFFRKKHEEMAKGKGYRLAEAFRRIVFEW
jgi:LmbE family N-acetylglucosaminyl deacetylase